MANPGLLSSAAFNEAVAKGGWKNEGPCKRTHAANLPGVIETSAEGDFWCAACGADLGIRECQGCCVQRHADILEGVACQVGGDVDHGCCYHDEPQSSEVNHE